MIAALFIAVLYSIYPSWDRDVVIVGEVHDNPAHHAIQADIVAELAPAALVFEMLTPEQAGRVTAEVRRDEATLEAALQWDGHGWPDFSMYYPIFDAAPEAAIYGAHLSRKAARSVMEAGAAGVFGQDAAAYGLSRELPAPQQAAREALQMTAHCDALPSEMLPGMVAIQRLRDAVLARAVVTALRDTGGPVAVITGNGHARKDWGVPAVLDRVAPEVSVYVIGQTEDTAPLKGTFDRVLSAPAVDRPDPCAAFD